MGSHCSLGEPFFGEPSPLRAAWRVVRDPNAHLLLWAGVPPHGHPPHLGDLQLAGHRVLYPAGHHLCQPRDVCFRPVWGPPRLIGVQTKLDFPSNKSKKNGYSIMSRRYMIVVVIPDCLIVQSHSFSETKTMSNLFFSCVDNVIVQSDMVIISNTYTIKHN